MRLLIIGLLFLGFVNQTKAQIDLQNGLLACYSFTGNAIDGTGNGNDGTVFGAQLTTDRFGASNSAYFFNGSSAYISLPSTNFTNNNYSYSLWVSAASIPQTGETGNIFSIGDASWLHQTVNLSNAYASAQAMGWTVGGYNNGTPATTGVQSFVIPPVNQWYHLVSTRSDSEMKMYMNGVLIGTASTNNLSPYYGIDVQANIGTRCAFIQYFHGKVDDFAIYDRVLNADEVMKLYTDGLACASPPVDLQDGLLACYSFTGNAIDGTGNGNDGTVHGAALTTDRFGSNNSAYYFNGSSYIQVPSANFINNNYSYSMWAAAPTPPFGEVGHIFSIGDANNKHQTVNLNNHYASADFVGWNTGGFNNGIPNGTSATAGVLPIPNRWYHIVATRSDTETKLYVDGVLVATSSTFNLTPFYGTDVTAVIGTRSTFIQYFVGKIDDFVIYDRAINAAEVLELYNVGIDCSLPQKPTASNITQCGGGDFTLTAGGGSVYRWYDAATGGNLLYQGNPYQVSLLQSKTFFVSAVAGTKESERTEVQVIIFPRPELVCNIPPVVEINQSARYELEIVSGTPPFALTYDFGNGTVVNTTEKFFNYTYESEGTYTVTITVMDANGCSGVCMATTEVEDFTPFIPNIITVNGDTFNSTFTIFEKNENGFTKYYGQRRFSLVIYNRWGKEIYATNDAVIGWDGNDSSPGGYFYTIQFGNKKFKGWVYVMQ